MHTAAPTSPRSAKLRTNSSRTARKRASQWPLIGMSTDISSPGGGPARRVRSRKSGAQLRRSRTGQPFDLAAVVGTAQRHRVAAHGWARKAAASSCGQGAALAL